jgi:hypothetical protein
MRLIFVSVTEQLSYKRLIFVSETEQPVTRVFLCATEQPGHLVQRITVTFCNSRGEVLAAALHCLPKHPHRAHDIPANLWKE